MSAVETQLIVTGSEAAGACGVDPYRSPVALWSKKLGLAPERETGDAAMWGNLLEPVILTHMMFLGFRVGTGHDLAAMPNRRMSGEVRNDDYPWLTGHPDGLTYDRDEPGILEIKTTSPFRRGEWDDGQIPPHVVVQMHVYCLLTGLRWGLAACLVGGQRLVTAEMEYDEDIAAIILEKTQEFLGYVERREPPPPDGAASTTAKLAALYRQASGEVVELTPELYALCREREALREQAKAVERQQEEKEQALKMALGDASVGMWEGRRVVAWTNVERKGYEVAAKSYRQFRVSL